MTPCCKLKDLMKKTQESLSWSTLGVRVRRAVIGRPFTDVTSSYLQMRTRRSLHTSARWLSWRELVAEFACLAGLLCHRNQNWYGYWLSSNEFDLQLWEYIRSRGVGRYSRSWSASFVSNWSEIVKKVGIKLDCLDGEIIYLCPLVKTVVYIDLFKLRRMEKRWDDLISLVGYRANKAYIIDHSLNSLDLSGSWWNKI